MGGRLDSTNVIKPMVSLITNIGFDHTNLLGNTLGEIASEKAGIIKKRIPVVISEKHPETEKIFNRKARTEKSNIYFSEEEYFPYLHRLNKKGAEISVLKKSKSDFIIYQLDLPGSYQKKNIAGVLKTLDILRGKGFKVGEDDVVSALSKVKKLTGLRGRFEKIRNKPLVIADTGHNAEGIKEVVGLLLKIKHKNLHIVFGMVDDKDPNNVLALMPKKNTRYYFTKSSVPRSMDSLKLKKISSAFGLKGKCYPDVKSAYDSALKAAEKEDMVFVGGSTFVVADLLSLVRK